MIHTISFLSLNPKVLTAKGTHSGLQIRVRTGKLFFLFLNQNIGCGYTKEPSQRDSSFEHPKHMFKLMGEEINAILGAQANHYLDLI